VDDTSYLFSLACIRVRVRFRVVVLVLVHLREYVFGHLLARNLRDLLISIGVVS
jgi:hypothetical protein